MRNFTIASLDLAGRIRNLNFPRMRSLALASADGPSCFLAAVRERYSIHAKSQVVLNANKASSRTVFGSILTRSNLWSSSGRSVDCYFHKLSALFRAGLFLPSVFSFIRVCWPKK